MIDFTPNPIAWSFGSLEIRWYGIAYIAAILVALLVLIHEARRRGERTDIIVDGLIVISAAALIGGRAYHVIDQWAYYSQHPANIVLPPYSGLGVYGGILAGLLVVVYLSRRWHVSLWRWGDIIVLAMLAAQTVGRWGNFMNQELYGPPTDLPWGIAIQCEYRVPEYACPAFGGTTPVDAHFHPLFLYESLLSLLGLFVLLWLWNRFTARKRYLIAGDVGLLYFVWYGLERSLLEMLRGGWNWTFNGVAVAQIVGLGGAATAIVVLFIRHWWVRGHPPVDEPSEPAVSAPGAA
jgi:phosphatidylglycerol:prolipoprotein diacylglycerol transferase